MIGFNDRCARKLKAGASMSNTKRHPSHDREEVPHRLAMGNQPLIIAGWVMAIRIHCTRMDRNCPTSGGTSGALPMV